MMKHKESAERFFNRYHHLIPEPKLIPNKFGYYNIDCNIPNFIREGLFNLGYSITFSFICGRVIPKICVIPEYC